MASVFLVQHVHELDDDREDVKLIGVYSSQAKAQAAVERLRDAPGFSAAQGGFHIEEYPLDKDHWTEGYISWAEALDAIKPSSPG
jgi:hypothetical protein